DQSVVDGTQYWYKVTAWDGNNESADSNIVGPRTSTDDNAPQIVDKQPQEDAVDVPVNANISFAIEDTGAGVDENTVVVTVKMRERGSATWQDVPGTLTFDSSSMPSRLGVVFDPDADFPYYAAVEVSVTAHDRRTPTPNTATDTWQFTIAGPPTYRVAGTIRQNDGTPLANVQVQVGPFTAVTNASGYYEVTGLAAGRYEVRPQLTNWAFTPQFKVVDVPPDQLGVDFTAVPGYDIRGTIKKTNGSGLKGVTVSAGSYSTVTDGAGRYVLADLPPGTHTVVPSLQGWSFDPPSRDVQLTDHNVNNQNFTASPVRYSISGRIATSLGDPVADVRVRVYDEGGSQVAWVKTAAPGTYVFTDLAPGRYTVRPEKNGFAFDPTETTLDLAGDTAGVDFEALPLTQVTLKAGYNFVGVSAFPVDDNPLHVFGVGDNKVARWDPEWAVTHAGAGYRTANSWSTLPDILRVQPGRGFWVLAPADMVAEFASRPLSPNASVDLDVYAGWNMLANPLEEPMPWAALGIVQGVPVRDFGFIYDKNTNSYVMVAATAGQGIVDTVPENAAFWLYGLDRTTLQVQPGAAAATASKQSLKLQAGDFLIPIAASTRDSRDAATLVGALSAGAIQVENPPAMLGMVDVYIEENGQAWAAAVRNQAAPKMTWRLAVVPPAGADTVALELPDLSRVPADKAVMLKDLETGRSVYMRTQPRYEFKVTEAGVRHFELSVEDKGSNCLVVSSAQARQEGLRAVVTFSLSGQARVRAEVLNIAGRVVRVLATDQPASAGVNSLAWDLRNAQGTPVPAGRYLVRIVAVSDTGQQVAAIAQVSVRR
ncbi:MAG: carboxypeptidase regulatory-like domain-containing protein, partial [Armatimonadetes bacterium]|nr:carboxypeptidase regulatory-like domain-containing protein [Armatimonadota bacterium]